MDLLTLNLINNEIARLSTMSNVTGLDLNDVKKLEILIKTRQLLLGEPTSITQDTSKEKEISNDELLRVLQGGK
jgi:hypothetical protein